MRINLIAATILLASTGHLLAQASPAGSEPKNLPLAVGFGYSNFYTDWNGRLSGPTVTVDWNSTRIRGLGIEVQGRDLNYGRAAGAGNLRFDTAEGGPVYTFRRSGRLQPFGEFFLGFGNIDFALLHSKWSHDTRNIYQPGGGVKYSISTNVWVRASYEYQIWPDLVRHHALTPNGLTVGAVYDLRGFHSRTY